MFFKDKNKPKILFFCGAGLSQESGLNTFRDSNGLWENYSVDEICNIKTFKANREKVFQFYNDRKKEILNTTPNAAHLSIANIQKKYGEENVLVFTSNIDDLLERAGVKNVYHVHGDIFNMKCLDCETLIPIGTSDYDVNLKCPSCDSTHVKPGVIFFGEVATLYEKLSEEFQIFGTVINNKIEPNIKIIVGTSLKVIGEDKLYPKRSRSILLDRNPNIEISENSFEKVLIEPATTGMLKVEEILNSWYQ